MKGELRLRSVVDPEIMQKLDFESSSTDRTPGHYFSAPLAVGMGIVDIVSLSESFSPSDLGAGVKRELYTCLRKESYLYDSIRGASYLIEKAL